MPRAKSRQASEDSASGETTNARSRRMSTPAFIGMLFVVASIVTGTAIAVASRDKGRIDVSATIQNANQRNREQYGDAAVIVNSVPEELRSLPNGGLIPQENQPENTPPIDTGTTTENETGDEQVSEEALNEETDQASATEETTAPETTEPQAQ